MASFLSVQYIDPFAPLPTGSSQAGVQATLDGAGVAAGNVAYAQLLANLTPIAYGVGATATAVRVFNTQPLAPNLTYQLQVQFSTPGQNPADLDWQTASILTAPVIVQQLRITGLTVTPSGLTFSWDVPGGAAIAGAYLQVIDATAGMTTQYLYLGTAPAASVPVTYVAGHAYQVTISGAQPIVAGATGGFNAPYTIGPPTTAQPIPTAAPVLTQTTYAGGEIHALWTAPTVPSAAATPLYELLLLDGANLVTAAPAGSTGGQSVTGQMGGLTNPQVAARVSYGSFVGPIGSPAPLYTLPPEITAVVITGAAATCAIKADLQAPGALPTGGALVATLYQNGVASGTQTLSSASGSVNWTGVAPVANAVYAIDVALVVTANSQVVQGPSSPRLILPLVAPEDISASYDGQTVTIGLNFAAQEPVDGYTVTLTDANGSQAVSTGSQVPISFAADLDLSSTWTVAVTPILGVISGLTATGPVATPTLVAPSLTQVAYDGAELALQWTAASLPFITGYQVKFSGGLTATLANQTSCVLPLTPAQASGQSVTVTALSPLRTTAASAAVAVLSNTVEITSVTVGSQVVAVWSASSAPPAVLAELLIGDTVQSDIAGATLTGVTFPPPTPAGQPFRLRARAVSLDGISSGPPATPVDLILTPPVFKSGYLADGQATLSWDPVNPFGVTAYLLTATPTTGSAASLSVMGDGFEGAAPAQFFEPGTLTITPTNARCAGPAASVPIHAAGAVTTGTFTNGLLSVTASVGQGQAGDAYWFDLMLDGGILNRQIATASGSPLTATASFPTALPQGASANVRFAGIGPGSLGPISADAAIPTAVPAALAAAYDGAQLHVCWTRTPGPGVDGYVVSVANTSVADTYVAGATSDTVAIPATLTYPFAANISVSVKAASGSPTTEPYVQGSPGPAIRPTLAGHAYSVAVAAAGDPPYVYRRGVFQTLADVSGQAIVLYLANPFTAGTPTIPSTGSPIFQLAPAAGNPQLPYQLTISADTWTTLGASQVRTALRQAYVQFLSDVEDAGVYPWALGLIRQIIAEAMPQTFAEVLYYRYGLWRDNSERIVDLTPGTRLQVSNALYESIVGGSSQKNGFYASGSQIMELVDAIPQGGAGTLAAGSGRSLSVDSFLSLIYPGGGGSAASRPVAAGPIDFFDDNNRLPYYRMFYPPAPLPSAGNGSTALEANITLIGAMSWKTLSAITDQYAATGVFPSGIDYFAAYFRGRSSLTPMITTTIMGEQRWLPLGVSVREALAAAGLAPYVGGNGGNALSMLRGTANLFAYPVADPGLSREPVNLGDQDLGGVTPLYWPVDMPLVGGDQVALRQT